mmetsp:Transcript_22700/g.63066  ORF Transcript_22700/g.63066 Transcript_22700/m.63066 type:complete len:711 (+) Transcript_22700:195-2327(+)
MGQIENLPGLDLPSLDVTRQGIFPAWLEEPEPRLRVPPPIAAAPLVEKALPLRVGLPEPVAVWLAVPEFVAVPVLVLPPRLLRHWHLGCQAVAVAAATAGAGIDPWCLVLGGFQCLVDALASKVPVLVVVPAPTHELREDPELLHAAARLLPVRRPRDDRSAALLAPGIQALAPARGVPARPWLLRHRHDLARLLVEALEPPPQHLLGAIAPAAGRPHADIEPLSVGLPWHGQRRNGAALPQVLEEVLAVKPKHVPDAILHSWHWQHVRGRAQIVLLAQLQHPTHPPALVLLEEGADALLAKVACTKASERASRVDLGVCEQEVRTALVAAAYALQVDNQQLSMTAVKGEMRKCLGNLRVLAVIDFVYETGIRVQLHEVAFQPLLAAEVVAFFVRADWGVQVTVEKAKLHPRRCPFSGSPELACVVLCHSGGLAEGRVRLEAPVLLEVLEEALRAHHVLHSVRRLQTPLQDHAVNQPHAALHEWLPSQVHAQHIGCPFEGATIELEGRLGALEGLPKLRAVHVPEDRARVRQLELHGAHGPLQDGPPPARGSAGGAAPLAAAAAAGVAQLLRDGLRHARNRARAGCCSRGRCSRRRRGAHSPARCGGGCRHRGGLAFGSAPAARGARAGYGRGHRCEGALQGAQRRTTALEVAAAKARQLLQVDKVVLFRVDLRRLAEAHRVYLQGIARVPSPQHVQVPQVRAGVRRLPV